MARLGAAILLATAGASLAHYGKPPCPADETAVMINVGSELGQICAAPCNTTSDCPTDLPDDFSGNLICGLKTKGQTHCELDCIVSSGVGDTCGKGGPRCEPLLPVPLGPGICAFPVRAGDAKPDAIAEVVAPAHPTLPTMWTATVKEDQVGVVHESETFQYHPDKANIAAKWTNYTDGSCQRLIYNNGITTRYLLGCDAVDCCYEDDTSGPIEYQIPNVHPALLSPVKSIGKESITLFDQSTVEADHWQWKFVIATYDAYTTTAADGSGILHRWVVNAQGEPFPNDYVNFKAVPKEEQESFSATFQVPQICAGGQALSCDGLHKQGKLSAKSIAFLRNGDKKGAIKETTPIFT